MTAFFRKHKLVLLYGILLSALLFLLKWLELRFIIISHSIDIYIGAIALIFTGLGIWLAYKLVKPAIKIVEVEKEVYKIKSEDFVPNDAEIQKLGLSRRELEVLQLMAEGCSNQEIAERLYLS